MRIYEKLLLGTCLILLGGLPSQAKEERVKMSALPAAVQATVKEQSKGATIRGFSKEIEKGKTMYEVELTVDGHGKDVSMDSSGTVVEVEEQVDVSSIPEAARTAIEKGADGGEVVKVEAVSNGTDSPNAYEAQIRKAGKKSEVRVAPDGSAKPED